MKKTPYNKATPHEHAELATLLVSTKFAPPRIGSGCVARRGLLVRLQQARQARLFIVSASAGYGKTTLIAQWRIELLKQNAAVAWLSLSPDDSHFPLFCMSLLGALQQAGVRVGGEPLLLNEPDDAGSVQAMAVALVNALAAGERELFLMLDDFHHVSDMRAYKLVQQLVESAPAHVHIVIAARAAPPLALGRLRAHGQLVELDCAELPFEFGESLDFLNLNIAGKLDVEGARVIHDLTDGWPIGLQLVTAALKANPKARSKLHRLAPHTVDLEAYLNEDVLQHLPRELLKFMETLSLFRRFNAGLAVAVTGNEQAEELIHEIGARGLFIFPVEASDDFHWYRFHPLFADFLVKRLEQGSADVADLHRKAARWFADHDQVPEAIRHALRGDEADMAVQLVESRLPTLSDFSELGTMLRLLERLPPKVIAQHPRLAVIGCLALTLAARLAKAESTLDQLDPRDLDDDTLQRITIIRAFIAGMRDDFALTARLGTPLAALRMADPAFEHLRVGTLVAACLADGRYTEARRLFQAHTALVGEYRSDETFLLAEVTYGYATLYEGDLKETIRIMGELLDVAERVHGRRSISALNGAATLAFAYYERGMAEAARQVLANRLDMLRFSFPLSMVLGSLAFARSLLELEGAAAALDFLARQETHFLTMGIDRGVAYVLAEQVRIVLAGGDQRRAAALLRALDELAARHAGADGWRIDILIVTALARARLALARSQPDAALTMLAEAAQACERHNKPYLGVTAALLMARAEELRGHGEASRRHLLAALETGSRIGMRRIFDSEGPAVRGMLEALQPTLAPELAGYLNEIIGPTPGAATGAPVALAATLPDQSPAAAALKASLAQREREILALLERSMTNKHIAAALNVSVDTVKWNLKNIFVKLEVSTRYQAITRSRQLGLAAD